MSKIDDFKGLLLSQRGKAVYVWGGNGEDLNAMSNPKDWIRRKEERYSDNPTVVERNVQRVLNLYTALKVSGISPIRAFDCSGLIYWCLKQLGIVKSDLNSRGLYGICTPITPSELRAGDLIFCYSDNNGNGQLDISEIYHVGAMISSEREIECIGRDEGVVELLRGKKWKGFGRPKAFANIAPQPDNPTEPTEPQPTQPEDPSVYWRDLLVTSPYMKGPDVLFVQTALVALEYSVGSCGCDGTYGNDTEQAVIFFQKDCDIPATGTVDFTTWSKLLSSLSEDITDEYYGDADGDGKITAADAAKILRSIVHLEGVLPLHRGDANNDGEISAADAAYILRCVVKLEKPKPIKETKES